MKHRPISRMAIGIFLGLLMVSPGCGDSDGNDAGNELDGDSDTSELGDPLVESDASNESEEPDSDPLDAETDEEEGVVFPTCGTNQYATRYLLPGPSETGYDADLAKLARQFDRQFHVFNARAMHVNTESDVSVEKTENRDLIERFLREDDTWDFETFSGGKSPEEVIDGWEKVAGLYGGMGIVADALRYAVLRDQGADCAEIDIAREQFKASMDGLHIAFAIAGQPGVVARGFARKDRPGIGASITPVPLFDGNGDPLPAEKDNGTWREDFSGQYPEYYWEDSCSRDMMLGWAAASGICMEVIKDDPSFPDTFRQRIREDSLAAAKELMKVRESGYDLEFPDADGRITFHGYLNEHCVERVLYSPSFKNGFYAMMALGIVGAFAYAADDPEVWSYLNDRLVKERDLPGIARDYMVYISMGLQSNFSNYSMVFTSAWLAMRYVRDPEARGILMDAIEGQLYNKPDTIMQPVEQKMSLYDFIYAASKLNGSAFAIPDGEMDAGAVDRGVETLQAYNEPPYFDYGIMNCDQQELESGVCELNDGTVVQVFYEQGRKGDTLCDIPIPKAIRGPSNYEWRSNPYGPNRDGAGAMLLPGVDFRAAYWIGRWTRLP